MDMSKVRRFVALKAHAKLAEDQAKRLKEELAELEDQVMASFEEDEVQNMVVGTTPEEMTDLEAEVVQMFLDAGLDRVRLGKKTTVYLRTQLWASATEGNYERACAALRAVGLEDMVQERFNSNTLSAYVREQADLGIPLPGELTEAITVTEKHSVLTRKG